MNVLFSSVTIGPISLKHRVVMAPLTRSRAVQPGGVPGDLMVEYYSQRASDGGLIITEASSIAAKSRGWYGAPGFYSDEQVESWKRVTAAVHAKAGRMFAQLWHTGRSGHVETSGGSTPVSASVDPTYWQDKSHLVSTPSGWQQPSPHRALETAEIGGIVEDYRAAAERAKAANPLFVEVAGRYRWWKIGANAQYFAGLTYLDMGQTGPAEAALLKASGSHDSALAALARMALAGLYQQTDRNGQAVDLYQQLIKNPTNTVPASAAKLQLAQLYETTNPAQAKKLYAEIKDQDKTTAAGQIAAQKLSGGKPLQ